MVGRQFQKSVSRYCDSTGHQSLADQSLSIHQPEFNISSSSWMPKAGLWTLTDRHKAKAQRLTIQHLGWTSLTSRTSFRSIRSSLGIQKLRCTCPARIPMTWMSMYLFASLTEMGYLSSTTTSLWRIIRMVKRKKTFRTAISTSNLGLMARSVHPCVPGWTPIPRSVLTSSTWSAPHKSIDHTIELRSWNMEKGSRWKSSSGLV